MKKKYTITISGCDDSTSIDIELTEEEKTLLDNIEKLIEVAAKYNCQPSLSISATS